MRVKPFSSSDTRLSLPPDSVQPEQLLLRLGEFDLERSNEPYAFTERKVQIIATHPQFDARTFEYDLALLRFVDALDLILSTLLFANEHFSGCRSCFPVGGKAE